MPLTGLPSAHIAMTFYGDRREGTQETWNFRMALPMATAPSSLTGHKVLLLWLPPRQCDEPGICPKSFRPPIFPLTLATRAT